MSCKEDTIFACLCEQASSKLGGNAEVSHFKVDALKYGRLGEPPQVLVRKLKMVPRGKAFLVLPCI